MRARYRDWKYRNDFADEVLKELPRRQMAWAAVAMMGSWAVGFAGTAAAALQVVPAPWPLGHRPSLPWGFLLLAVLGGRVKWALAAALHRRRLAKAPGVGGPGGALG